jgi:hypothetical protein
MNPYHYEHIRVLLTQGFTEPELRRLCHDQFRPVYDAVAQTDGKEEMDWSMTPDEKSSFSSSRRSGWPAYRSRRSRPTCASSKVVIRDKPFIPQPGGLFPAGR